MILFSREVFPFRASFVSSRIILVFIKTNTNRMISTIVITSQLNGAILYDIAEQIGLIIVPVELEIGLPVGLNGLYLWPEINLSECGFKYKTN